MTKCGARVSTGQPYRTASARSCAAVSRPCGVGALILLLDFTRSRKEKMMRSWTQFPGILALAVAAMLAGGCNRAPDPKDRVERDLKQANIADVNVDYDRTGNVV